MSETRSNFFVLTGGPGAGKSALLESLRASGLACVTETGRRIIRTQIAIGGNALPWERPDLYAELELGSGLLAYHEADAARTTVFDRGIVDPIGFLAVTGLPIPAHMREAVRKFRYHRSVFVAPPWKAIYARDAERRQSFAEARATCAVLVRVYTEAGYRPVPLPLASVETRTAFVLEAVDAAR